MLTDLRDRLARTRWPDRETVDDWSQGIPFDYVREVCAYWADGYDWRRCEATLNALGQVRVPVDGLTVHALHVPSPEPDALPLVVTHGWPGSVIEFLKVIGPLTDPRAHGDDPADAFTVVCPSIPGYGFSDKPTRAGWGVDRIASAWTQLMARLGYARFGAQGGDWGAAITTALGRQAPEGLVGIHVNMPIAGPDPATMDDLTDRERSALGGMQYYRDVDSGYSKQQSTRPQTVGYALADSPAGQAAWILEKFWAWTDCDGHPEHVLTRDELLDNVMLYWLPNAAASSARLYWESFSRMASGTVDVPAGATIFPKEIFRPSRRWAERRYRNLRFWNERDRGGHFAAFEQPAAYVEEVRRFFRLVR